ncbi:MAG: hypothetical protein RIR79_1079 [Pseudomonadota bacterium]|jgi:hypothetical protein
MATHYVMQRDTKGWRVQVWISFITAIAAASYGVVWMPGQDLDRAFLAIGLFFCLFSSFTVAKTLRDNRDGQVDTGSWVMVVWIAFAAAFSLTAWGLWRMNIEGWQKAYMVVSWLFLVNTTFTVAKTVRDQHEADLMERNGNAEN